MVDKSGFIPCLANNRYCCEKPKVGRINNGEKKSQTNEKVGK